jgi:2-(1,2-epoxy-1,2-dihydrophenyl)acetyl-CoA isomerase
MMMLGERIDAGTAHEWGMIYRVVPDARLGHEAMLLARRLAAGPTVALGLLRQGVSYALDRSYAEALMREAENQRTACRSDDSVEGVSAFLSKRLPAFNGR